MQQTLLQIENELIETAGIITIQSKINKIKNPIIINKKNYELLLEENDSMKQELVDLRNEIKVVAHEKRKCFHENCVRVLGLGKYICPDCSETFKLKMNAFENVEQCEPRIYSKREKNPIL